MDDLISRQAVIRWVKTECNPYGKPTLDFESGKKFIEHLEQMPTAEKKGKWVLMSDCTGKYYACSWCGREGYPGMNYCPYCGARMEA